MLTSYWNHWATWASYPEEVGMSLFTTMMTTLIVNLKLLFQQNTQINFTRTHEDESVYHQLERVCVCVDWILVRFVWSPREDKLVSLVPRVWFLRVTIILITYGKESLG